MQCPYCKNELNLNSTYCPQCGQSVKHRIADKSVPQVDWNKYNELADNERKNDLARKNREKAVQRRR